MMKFSLFKKDDIIGIQYTTKDEVIIIIIDNNTETYYNIKYILTKFIIYRKYNYSLCFLIIMIHYLFLLFFLLICLIKIYLMIIKLQWKPQHLKILLLLLCFFHHYVQRLNPNFKQIQTIKVNCKNESNHIIYVLFMYILKKRKF